MLLRKRRTILGVLTLLFVLVGGYLLMLANGLIIDVAKLDIVRTGSLFLKFFPEDAKVKLNGRTVKANFGILSGGALIKNLRPGIYEIEIAKENTGIWKKTLAVESGRVTPATRIILWPENFTADILDDPSSTPTTVGDYGAGKNVESFYVADDAVVTKKNNLLFFDGDVIKGNDVMSAYSRSKSIITEDALNNYYLINLDAPKTPVHPPTLPRDIEPYEKDPGTHSVPVAKPQGIPEGGGINITNLFNSLKQTKLKLPGTVPIKNISFHPFSDNKIILMTENSVYVLDVSKIDLERVMGLPQMKAFAVSQGEVFAINASGTIESFDLTLRRKNTAPFSIQGVASMSASKNGRFLALVKTDGELFVLAREKDSLTLLDKNSPKNWFSPEGKRIAYTNERDELFVYHMEDFDLDERYEEGTLLAAGENVGNFEWLPGFPNYALISSGRNLFISEVYGRGYTINKYEISKDTVEYFYSKKELYLLSEDGVLAKVSL